MFLDCPCPVVNVSFCDEKGHSGEKVVQNWSVCAYCCTVALLSSAGNNRRSGVVVGEMTTPAGRLHVTLRDHLSESTVR